MHRCTTHALYWSKLWQQDHCQQSSKCKSGLPQITGTCPGWWKQSFWLRLRSLVRFQVRATSCHLTSSKSAWKSIPKCTWMCCRVWWSPDAIRWPVADPGMATRLGTGPQVPRDPGLASEGVIQLFTLLTLPLPNLNSLDYFVWSYVENITNTTSHSTKASLIAAEYSPSSCRRLWKRPAPSSGSVSRRWLRLKAVTLNWCQLYYII